MRRGSGAATRLEQGIARQPYEFVNERGMLPALGARLAIELVPAGMLSWHELVQEPIALGEAQVLHVQVARIMVLVRLALQRVRAPDPVGDRHGAGEAQLVTQLGHLRIEFGERGGLRRRGWRSCVRTSPQHAYLIHRRCECEALLRRPAGSRRS